MKKTLKHLAKAYINLLKYVYNIIRSENMSNVPKTYQSYINWKEKSKQTEYTEETPLLAPDGDLLAAGWAKHNVFDYNRTFVKPGNPMSQKEWDFYQVSNGRYMVQLSFANISIGGYIAGKLIDLVNGKVIADATQLFLGGKNKYVPPKKGDVPNRFAFKIGKAEFDFDTREDSRTLWFRMPLKELWACTPGMGFRPSSSLGTVDANSERPRLFCPPTQVPGLSCGNWLISHRQPPAHTALPLRLSICLALTKTLPPGSQPAPHSKPENKVQLKSLCSCFFVSLVRESGSRVQI